MTYETILCDREEGVGIVRLNRPERMNAVTEQMYLELRDVFGQALRDDAVRAMVLTGSVLKRGDTQKQAFCAGADLKQHAAGERTHAQKRAYILLAHETTREIHEFSKPVIAAVNGPARGAGAELALCCDFIFMAEQATIAFPETGLGTFVGGGSTYHLPRLVGTTKAKELIYTGRVLDGLEAVEFGVAFRCRPIETLLKDCLEFASTLSGKAPVSMRLAKKYLQKHGNLDLETVLALETEAVLTCMDTEDWHEGIRAFNEKRKPNYQGR